MTGEACHNRSPAAKEINMFPCDPPSGARCWAVFGVLALALAVDGCGPPQASVSGSVTFNGQPFPSGTVLFHGADGRVEHALISEDGSYTIANAPLGELRITVRSHATAPLGFPAQG